MSQVANMIQAGALGLAASGLLYTASTAAAALTALYARGAARRRDARKVLALLLRRTAAPSTMTRSRQQPGDRDPGLRSTGRSASRLGAGRYPATSKVVVRSGYRRT